MDRHERIVAIAQTLPGIESFLKEVLGNEPLSSEADKQRLEFLRRLESISDPPSLPPRPPGLGLRRRLAQQQESTANAGSHQIDETNSTYRNEVDFASKQRDLARARTLSATRKEIIGDEGLEYISARETSEARYSISSYEDDIYERLSSAPSVSPQPVDIDSKVDESPELTSRGTPIQSSGGKGKLWFSKRETKTPTEICASDLLNPSIKGYLKDVKTNKKRWCVIHNEHFFIFRNRDDPAIQIIDLPSCTIGVDDKKKISYSFKLTVAGSPSVSLAIEDGHDLSPWMSAIMAAAVRRGTGYRPISPLENAFSLKQAQEKVFTPPTRERRVSEEADQESVTESFYESPSDLLLEISDTRKELFNHSTPIQGNSDLDDKEGYFAPLPPLPTKSQNELDSSSDSSSDEEDEDIEEVTEKKEKIYDEIPADLLKKLTEEQNPLLDEIGRTNSGSLGEDSQSEHSTTASNRHSYLELLASDDTGSSQGENSRKRTSTALSIGSVDSDGEASKKVQDASFVKPLALKVKRRRKQPPVEEARLQFFQDSSATYCGVLYQKRKQGVWSKRYCKIINNHFKCYRHPGDQQPCLDIAVMGHDFTLIDSKESKKNYAFKMSHPDDGSLFFATNSRQAVGKWIELLSLAATGGQNIVAPYPPYFSQSSSQARSRESLVSSEGLPSEGNSVEPPAVVPRDYPLLTETQGPSTHMDEDPYDEAGCATKQLDGRNVSHSRNVQGSSSSSLDRPKESETSTNRADHQSTSAVKDRVPKRRKEKPVNTGRDTPSTMSPPHSLYIGENAEGGVHPEPNDEPMGPVYENLPKVSQDDLSVGKKDKSWVEALRKKPGKIVRGYTSIGFETSKKYPNSVRKKGDQGFSHLLTLFDKEGRFCGYLTEVKAKKFSTTHVRRWCIVKNGALHMYHGQSDEKPEASLSLVDMWLTDESNEAKTKLAFGLHDKDGRAFQFQANGKEDFSRWMGVLQLFTALRLERKLSADKEPLRKTDSSGTEDGDHSLERGTTRSKSSRSGNRIKDEGFPAGKQKSSFRSKISQRVNVKDIFKKGHNFYDIESLQAEGNYINTVAYHSGTLTEVTDEVGLKGKARWCAVREKELLVYSDAKAIDPLRRFPLRRSFVEDITRPESTWFWFQVRCSLDVIVLATRDQTDFERWLKMLLTSREDCSYVDENPTCAGRLAPSTLGGILHKRNKSETLSQKLVSPPPAEFYTPADEYVSSVSTTTQVPDGTDVLLSGYLQEMLGDARVKRWCVLTAEQLSVFEDESRSSEARSAWPLVDITLKDARSADAAGCSSFLLYYGNQVKRYQHKDKELLAQWINVLSRYCRPLTERVKSVESLPAGRLKDNRKSASFNDVKMLPDEEQKAQEVLSEGRASGKKTVRKISDDNSLFRRFSRPDLFKAPWRASSEKLNVKLREKSTRRKKDDIDRRFSCGNLFDSEGRFCGHLMEVTASELCLSEVRRWCQLRGDDLYVYEHQLSMKPRKILPLINSRVVNQSDVDKGVFRFRLECAGDVNITLRALTRNDFEKWQTVISVKSAVLFDRSERMRRTRSMILEDTLSIRSRSSEFSSLMEAEEPKQLSEFRRTSLKAFPSVSSDDSVFLRLADGDVTSPFGNHHVAGDSTHHEFPDPTHHVVTNQDPLFLVADEDSGIEHCSASDETVEAVVCPGSEVTEHVESVARVANVEEKSVEIDDDLVQVERDNEAEECTERSETTSLAENAEEPDEGSLGDSQIEELSALYENFVAFAAALNNWYQDEKESRAKERAEALYENIPFAYEQLLRERQASNEDGASSADASVEGAAENAHSKVSTHSPSTVAWKFGKMHLQDGVAPSGTFEPASEAVGSGRPYSGIYGESELEELESEKDRSETFSSLNFEDAEEGFGFSQTGEQSPDESSYSIVNQYSSTESSRLERAEAEDSSYEAKTEIGRSRPNDGRKGSVDNPAQLSETTATRQDELSCETPRDSEPEKLSVGDKLAECEPCVTELTKSGFHDYEGGRLASTIDSAGIEADTPQCALKKEECTDLLNIGATDEEQTHSAKCGNNEDEKCNGSDSAVSEIPAPDHVAGVKENAQNLIRELGVPSGDAGSENPDDKLSSPSSLDTYFGPDETQTVDEALRLSQTTEANENRGRQGAASNTEARDIQRSTEDVEVNRSETQLSTSPTDLLRAFKDILELHGDESDIEDTRF